MHLKYNLFKLDKALTFQVCSQGSALTVFLRELGEFKSSNGWRVATRDYPGIDMQSGIIYIRGYNHELDTRPDSVFGITDEYRDELVTIIYTALQELLRAAIGSENQIEYPTFDKSEFIPMSCKPVPCSIRHITL